MKFKIDRALARYNVENDTTLTRRDLADTCVPGKVALARHLTIKNMAEGTAPRPDPNVIVNIAKKLNVDINYLFGWEDKK